MKLLKPKNSDFWHVIVATEDGGEKSVNLYVATRDEAEEIVQASKLKELETASKAHRLTAEVVSLITANRTVTVAEAIAEWHEWAKIGVRSDKTRQNINLTLGQWARECGLDKKPVAAVTFSDIHGWINRPGSTLKRGTRALNLSCVRALMRYCSVQRYVLADPSATVRVDFRAMSHEQLEVKHKKAFGMDDIAFLLANSKDAEPSSLSPGFFQAAITIGVDMAIRLSDICNLEWSCFDYSSRTMTLWSRKTHSRIQLPLTARVLRLLTTLPATDKQYLFPAERAIANNADLRATLSTMFVRYFNRMGYEGYSFHSLRATYATDMAANGATMEEIRASLGHTTATTTKVYVRNQDAAKVASR